MDVKKTEKLEVRMTSEEKESPRLASERLGVTISEFIRMVAMNTARTLQAGGSVEDVLESFGGSVTAVVSRIPDVTPYVYEMSDEGEVKAKVSDSIKVSDSVKVELEDKTET